MLRATLLIVVLFFNLYALGQGNVKAWDKVLWNRIKGKLKYIPIGTRSNGLAIFYFKSDSSVFSVIKRDLYATGKRTDSASSFCANFRNDTLFRVAIQRRGPLEKRSGQGVIIMYLDGDKILAQEVKGKVYVLEISKISEIAYQLLSRAKELIGNR